MSTRMAPSTSLPCLQGTFLLPTKAVSFPLADAVDAMRMRGDAVPRRPAQPSSSSLAPRLGPSQCPRLHMSTCLRHSLSQSPALPPPSPRPPARRGSSRRTTSTGTTVARAARLGRRPASQSGQSAGAEGTDAAAQAQQRGGVLLYALGAQEEGQAAGGGPRPRCWSRRRGTSRACRAYSPLDPPCSRSARSRVLSLLPL